MHRGRVLLMYAACALAVLGAIYGAATLALQRDGLLVIDAASASRLDVDYSIDDHPPLLPPLDPGIVADIVNDEEQLPPRPQAAEPTDRRDGPTAAPVPTQPAGPASTPEPAATATPAAAATDTPEPGATDTPEPGPTDTPEPRPTDTAEPDPTETPEPDPTDTPTPTKTPRRCSTPLVDLPPVLESEDEECRKRTPTPTQTPKKEPTSTPTSTIDDVINCVLQPLECL